MALILREFTVDTVTQASNRYPTIPFQVPEGTQSIGVKITFDRDKGVVDLGCESPGGFVGWSGGARDRFVIGEEQSTPGYLSGPIEPGEWKVVLGLHLVPKGPFTVKVEISLPSAVELPMHAPPPVPAVTARGSGRDLPAAEGLTWFAGDPHNHTFHSDGKHSIEELAVLGVERGLDYLGVADHNTVSHHRFLPEVSRKYGITLIPGQEITSFRGHANAYGDIGFVDFRQPAAKWMADVKERGGLFSVNHPIDVDCSFVDPLPGSPAAAELWHASWYKDVYGDGIFAWLATQDRSGMSYLGGSDFHTDDGPQRPGTPVTWIAATDNSAAALIEGMRLGRTTLTGSVTYEGGVLEPIVMDAPILLRQNDQQILAVGGKDLIFQDFYGNRQVLEVSEQALEAPRRGGPYSLMLPDRRILAISP